MKVLLDENLAHRLRQVTQSLTLRNPCAPVPLKYLLG
jgi:hypothetical protein